MFTRALTTDETDKSLYSLVHRVDYLTRNSTYFSANEKEKVTYEESSPLRLPLHIPAPRCIRYVAETKRRATRNAPSHSNNPARILHLRAAPAIHLFSLETENILVFDKSVVPFAEQSRLSKPIFSKGTQMTKTYINYCNINGYWQLALI